MPTWESLPWDGWVCGLARNEALYQVGKDKKQLYLDNALTYDDSFSKEKDNNHIIIHKEWNLINILFNELIFYHKYQKIRKNLIYIRT